jgi:hypothetical protein
MTSRADTLTDGNLALSGEHNSRKRDAVPLPVRCLRQEILVLGEQNAAQRYRSIHHIRIVSAAIAIFLDGDGVHAAFSDPPRDGAVDVFVHVESDHYGTERSSRFFSLASSCWRVNGFGF